MLIKFSQIIPPKGDDPTDSRRTGRQDGIKALKASIAEHGLLQAPAVIEEQGKRGPRYRLIDGRRRWQAIKMLIDEGTLDKGFSFDAQVFLPDANGLELSLAANIVREPLHPVDEFEDFAMLVEQGSKSADIAKRFGISKKHVEQRLALGKLHPDVRASWRAGKLDADAAQAFTLGTLEQQEAIHRALPDAIINGGSMIRQRILGYVNEADAKASLKFVGRAAYEKAGGAIAADLFGEGDLPLDLTLLRRLADEQLEKACEQIEADGAAFAILDRDIPASDRALYSDSTGKRAGAILSIGADGKLVTRRVTRATIAEQPAKPMRKQKAPKSETGGLSAKTTERFEQIIEVAVRKCIEDDPDLAETILCAALISDPTPAIDFRRREAELPTGGSTSFGANLDTVAELDTRPREELFTQCIAQLIDLRADRDAAKVLLETIPSEDFQAAYRFLLGEETTLYDIAGRRDSISIIRAINPKGGDPGALSDDDLKLEVSRLVREHAWMPPQFAAVKNWSHL